MAIVRITRFKADPANAEKVIEGRNTLVDEVRTKLSGLTSATLTRVDDENWLDVWRYESAAAEQEVLAAAPALTTREAAFALVSDITAERAEVVDER